MADWELIGGKEPLGRSQMANESERYRLQTALRRLRLFGLTRGGKIWLMRGERKGLRIESWALGGGHTRPATPAAGGGLPRAILSPYLTRY